ncbi:MAG TPA: hypothetical protein VKC66_03370 [Xanthobacteraceae bacterium]|nr:hypothetical protein [Xanthobacteraceae bacterium]
MFGNVAPIRDRRVELLVALVDFPGKVVAGADLGDDLLADLAKNLQQRFAGVVGGSNNAAARAKASASRA